ncbi:hypothetical protein [Dellaglioa algida]|uniref:hypothetical protein n=1 Tax=Dellaglioa algida TaxID=105612 RepID=UPI0024C4A52C|nr:hypothetical protein [Dellaglioa algida]MDK1728361.1 hypothetical protein [Dellaglioa algida]MDK1736036.1 hypothetical protein [Dellaglioa algida]MDK1737723.1 hypothetical protein [Dellaglioa algida]
MGRKGWIILLTFITVSVIGGNFYKAHEKKVEEKNRIAQIKAEYNAVVALKKEVAGIKSIKFNKAHYNSMVNGYNMDIDIYSTPIDQNIESSTSTYFNHTSTYFNYNDKYQTVGHFSMQIGFDVDKGVTKGKVEVTYTNGKKTSI